MKNLKYGEKAYTFDEYLVMEEAAEYRSEYINGNIIEMSGGSRNHSKISNSIGTAIDNEMIRMEKDCSFFNSDMKVYISKHNRGFYPDGMVVCGEEKVYKNNPNVLINPSLIIEVLSKSTRKDDKGDKFELYRSLDSFKEYMLVWQTVPKVQTWYKEAPDLWRISSAFGLDKSIHLYSIDCDIALKDIYRVATDLREEDYDGSW